jgi:hypothetical protein
MTVKTHNMQAFHCSLFFYAKCMKIHTTSMQFELDTHYMSTRKNIKVKKLFWFKIKKVKLLCSVLEQAHNTLFKYSVFLYFSKTLSPRVIR